MIDDLSKACSKISEDSLYTAQAHFFCAKKWHTKSFWLVVVPSFMAGLAGFIVAMGGPSWIAAISALGGLITAVASWVGVERDSIRHEFAGKMFTSLRHEADVLNETLKNTMPPEEFKNHFLQLHKKYLLLSETLEITEDDCLQKARENVQQGIFLYDFQQKK